MISRPIVTVGLPWPTVVICKHLLLFTGTRIRIDSVMYPGPSSRGHNTSASVTISDLQVAKNRQNRANLSRTPALLATTATWHANCILRLIVHCIHIAHCEAHIADTFIMQNCNLEINIEATYLHECYGYVSAIQSNKHFMYTTWHGNTVITQQRPKAIIISLTWEKWNGFQIINSLYAYTGPWSRYDL